MKTALGNMRAYLAGLFGTDGEIDTAKSTLGIVGAPGKNLITNGAMQVNQEGDKTGVTTSTYICDVHQIHMSALGTWSISQVSDAPEGFANSIKIQCTTADATPGAASYLYYRHKIEGQDLQHIKKGTANAKQLSLSFEAKAFQTGTYQFNLLDEDNTRLVSGSFTIDASGAWESKSHIFPADTVGAFDDDANSSLHLEIWLDSGSNFTSGAAPAAWETTNNADKNAAGTVNLGDSISNYFQITGVQLVPGGVATEYDHRRYEKELERVNRQYCTSKGDSTGAPSNADGGFYGLPYSNGTEANGLAEFPVPMRATPTVVLYDNTGVSGTVTQIGVANGIAATATNINSKGFVRALKSSGTWGQEAFNRPIAAGFTADARM